MIPIRSYVRRQGRMVKAQKRAIDELWVHYGVADEGTLDLELLFGRPAPLHLEIGFGMGDALLEMAQAHPENNYLGVEVHLPGVGQLLLRLREMAVTNVRIYCRDAIEVLDLLPNLSLARVYLFFPDPWSKQRYHKRRLVQPNFVEKLRKVLKPGGLFHAVTDWDDYACHIQKVMGSSEGFSNRAGLGKFHPRPVERPMTKFEQHALRQGHEIRELLYDRI